MDILLSCAAGFGLRVYLIRAASPTSFITPAVLGLWEGILVSQLSLHPPPNGPSSPLDHYLAFGLRLVVDFLLQRNWLRVMMVGLWAALGAIISESAFPSVSNSLSSSVHRASSRRDREKRHRHPRPAPSHFPSHIRVYQEPEESPPSLAIRAPQPQTAAHIQAINVQLDAGLGQVDDQILVSPNRPPSPPSFFYADTEPSPFPESPASPLKLTTTAIVSQVPVRPRSAMAFYGAENLAPPEPSHGPSSQSPHLPTPPDSTFRERTMDSRVDRLSTIEEITSRSEHVSEGIEQGEAEEEENCVPVSHGGGAPLPVPNPTSQYIRADEGTPPASMTSSSTSSTVPLPIPYPPRSLSDGGDELRTPGQHVYNIGPESDPGDELMTPPVLRATTTSTPGGVSGPSRGVLSPLMLDSQSIAPDQEQEFIQVPGTTISTYTILQRPVAPLPLGPLLDAVANGTSGQANLETDQFETASVASDAESVLSTGIPTKLLEHAEDYRKQAVEEGKEKVRLQRELSKAVSERRAKDALFLRGDLQTVEAKIKQLHEKAEKRYYQGRNSVQKPGTIDVHGLKPEEALQRTEKAFRELLMDGQSTLNVIVGKGLHSKNGVPVVKNYIMEMMRKQHIPCRVDPFNAGKLILTLSPGIPDHPPA